MNVNYSRATRVALLAASSFSALALAAPAAAKGADYSIGESDRLSSSEALRSMVSNANVWTPDLRIVTNDGPFITPAPGKDPIAVKYANSKDVLDPAGTINGVGQMIAIEFPFLGLCTGSLINPRTVITAAHCVYDNPAHMYGSVTGTGGGVPAGQGLPPSTGIPLSFGFESTNRCRGIQVNGCAIGTGPYEMWRDSGYQTQTSRHIYNANQVWYHPDSVREFGLADIALVTLDTHVQDIPTWTLLFSPLTGDTHVTITGYGGAGVGTSGQGDAAGIDYRRRSAENMIQALMSSDDWASSPALGSYQGFSYYGHSLYWMDFDDPNRDLDNPPPNFFNNTAAEGEPDNGYYDFDGLPGDALPREGTTAGGDSGGPLIVDQRWDRDVIAGVLTGGWSFGGSSYYGEFSVYPPLFLYWQDIVANNPYKYVSARAGDGDWFDPTHWVQDMDPNYAVIGADGQLVNSLPSIRQLPQDSDAGRFGTICFLGEDCSSIQGSVYPGWNGSYVYTAGGPGSTNLVPNNVEPVNSATPSRQVPARYYDVTLSKSGTTTLGKSATIDKLTLAGSDITTRLNITSTGSLSVWGDFNQLGGWTNVDGLLRTSEALIGSGILSGRGVLDPTYLTVVGGAVAPGGGDIGTLTVRGNVIMASASGLLIDMAGTNSSDRLQVLADANIGQLALNGGSLVLSQLPGGAPIRDRGSYIVATAQGGVNGKFGTVSLSNGGSLVPTVSYTGGQVKVTLKAGSLTTTAAGTNSTTLAFAGALDALRGTSYGNLWNLYGSVDLMNADQLSATFNALSPANFIGETRLLQDRQSSQLLGNVSDRLSLLGTGQAKGISFTGGASAFERNRESLSATAQLGLTSSGPTMNVPVAGGLSGFVTMGGDSVRSSYGEQGRVDAGQRSRYFASGIEAPFGDAIVGTAIGYGEAASMAGSDEAKSKVTQAAAYASLPLGKSAYVGGVVAAERARVETSRFGTDTVATFALSGGAHSSRYMATAEAGFRTDIGHGLSLNPRAQIGYSRYSLGGLREHGGETALELNDLTVNRIESRIGARLDGTATVGKWALRPQVQADYVRLLSGANNGMSVSFAAAPEYDFLLPLTNSGSGWMEVKGGVEMSRGAFTVGLSGQATAGDVPISDQRGAIDLKFKF